MSARTFQTGLPPASDRMLTTCFLAALIHAIVILGVTFRGQHTDPNSGEAALEVVLVNDEAPAVDKNPDAAYLAQRSQRGSGNTQDRERTRIPTSSLMPADRAGIPDGDGVAAERAGRDAGDDEVIATPVQTARIVYFAASTAADQPSEVPLLLEKKPDLGMTPNDDGVQLRMRGRRSQQLWITADTRESDVAVYLDSWRRKIERVGTIHFPAIARRESLTGTPVIEVTIGADGRLIDASLKSSSGHPELDEAAMRILKLASPFDPFPRALGAKHDEIRIAYEWQFLGGTPQGSGVFYAEPNDPGATPGATP